ncbi:LysE family translocator [Brevundimonas sp. AJA228-03]|uniref:LysE family translocator n=1 Tax=Brevundimonas sp. AJA228-03 TaxID=2752515 RepID=UPI001AE0B99B|nr:LysE family translocator [Brevundimonas sp. AJA228-03]QTN19761.1 LysE family translocator [Brevundimonas sp. AJA228-03]
MTLPVDPHLFWVFMGVMMVLAVTPGPANLFSVAAGIERGRRAALIAVLGMNTATLVWFAAAALGLGALVAALPQVFRVVAIGGALYVAWLGISSLRGAFASRPEAAVTKGRTHPRRPAFVDGFLVQLANPKIVLFFSAVLPPFMDAERPAAPQLAVFACVVVGMDLITMSAYGLGGAALARRMNEPRFRRAFGVLVGVLLLLASVLIVSRLE